MERLMDLHPPDQFAMIVAIGYKRVNKARGVRVIKKREVLGIGSKISWSMDYSLIEGKTEKLIDLCKQAGATEYISGLAAKDYLNEELFRDENILLRYMDYSGYPEYNQFHPPFEHGVSIIDLIFHEGPQAPKYMKSFRDESICFNSL